MLIYVILRKNLGLDDIMLRDQQSVTMNECVPERSGEESAQSLSVGEVEVRHHTRGGQVVDYGVAVGRGVRAYADM